MKEREVAFNCLCKVIINKQYSNIALRNIEGNTSLVTQLVYGTLRNYRLTRSLWEKYATKKPNEKICVLLDMAVYELVLLDKPNYATVNEIVDISKKIAKGSYTSLVNALLRKVNKEDIDKLSLAQKTSHPDWLVGLWNAHYGKEVTEKICEYDNIEARVSLRVNTLLTSKEELLKDSRFKEGTLPDCLYFQGNIIQSDYFKENKVIIQSESSQMAVNTLDIKDGMQILDLCAAPGSKSMQMATKLHGTGKVVANDLYDFRVQLIKDNALKYGLSNIEAVNYDGLKIDEYYPAESFDAVLLDAPCSGLGTLRHKPEIKMFIEPKDLDDIVSLQHDLLIKALQMVKKGGQIVYSTCTLNKKENDKQIINFLKENENVRLISEKTIFPFDFNSDGFYIALLEKQG